MDYDTMGGDSYLPVAQKLWCPHFFPMSETSTMDYKYYFGCTTYARSYIWCENLYCYYLIYSVSHNSKYHWTDDSCSIKIKVKGVNIKIVYNMLDCELRMIHVEYDTIKSFPFRQNNNVYTISDNKYDDGSCIVISDEGFLCNTIIPENNGFIKQQHSYQHIIIFFLSIHWLCKIRYILKWNKHWYKYHHSQH